MTQENLICGIGIDDWCALAQNGAAPPVMIPLMGNSMLPLIRRNVDPVTIVPLKRPLKKGDVILFTTRPGRYVVHRVWKIRENEVRPFGDHCAHPDPWIPRENVLGQVICFRRNGAKHRLDTAPARLWGRVWMALFPLRMCCRKLKASAGRHYRRIFSK